MAKNFSHVNNQKNKIYCKKSMGVGPRTDLPQIPCSPLPLFRWKIVGRAFPGSLVRAHQVQYSKYFVAIWWHLHSNSYHFSVSCCLRAYYPVWSPSFLY